MTTEASTNPKTRFRYRSEIDGLRAIAVIAVIIYHLKIVTGTGYFFPGGFLGVDVFFVLSGYLITRLLLNEIDDTGAINVAKFYTRRARRILPALLLVILFCLVCSFALQMPHEVETFSMSILAGLAFVSNIFWFFEQTEYGAQSAVLQPLLHLWSLAIEEQFYLVFPLVLILLRRMGRTGIGLIVLTLGSLVVAHFTLQFDRNLAFYAPTGRAWELLAGSLLAWSEPWTRLRKAAPWRDSAFLLIAIAVLLHAFLTVDLGQSSHPGLSTVPVIAATCAIIFFGSHSNAVTGVLSSPPMVLCGKLSYSLYLWHFPVFAYGRLIVGEPGPLDMAIALVVTFVLSYVGYKVVENPFRHRIPMRTFVYSVTASFAVMGVFIAGSVMTNGYPARVATTLAAYDGNEPNNEILRDQSWTVLESLNPAFVPGTSGPYGPSAYEADHLWFGETAACKLLVVGDSHAKDLFNAVHFNLPGDGSAEIARFGMLARLPEDQRQRLYASPNFEAADTILLSFLYVAHDNHPAETIGTVIDEVQARGKRVLLVGNTAQFKTVNGIPIFDWYVRTRKAQTDYMQIDKAAFGYRDGEVDLVNEQLRQVAAEKGVPFLDRDGLVCDTAAGTCTLSTPDRRKTMSDYGHWTLDGATYFGAALVERGWLSEACSSN